MVKKVAIAVAILFAIVCAVGIWFFVSFWRSMERGEERARQVWRDQASGRAYFEQQPALLAVAQAIAANDPQAIRTTAKALPDLNTPTGEDGATLLYFAVSQSWLRRELVDSVKTLLELGADPNHTNGGRNSYAMAAAVHSTVDVLRAMLDAGGNPNGRDEFGRPIVCMTWYLGYHKAEARSRLALLLDRGADINSVMPENDGDYSGYSLLLFRLRSAPEDPEAYADAQFLLERGADPSLAARDGMTLAKRLTGARETYARQNTQSPAQFTALCNWATEHGIAIQ